MDASMINKIQKSKDYARDPKRATFHTLVLEFRGDNNSYTVALAPDGWSCTCPGFQTYSICPHIMSLEKIFQAMLKRDPLPYAPGQNIVSDVTKAKRYSEELDRMKIISFEAAFKGDNKDHTVTYNNGTWDSTSSYFKSHGIGAYTMAMERILGAMVDPIRQPAYKDD
ncbi:MAG: SWIM zinc finger family protein [Anaerolineae bacterium]|nr:SWIM zinc finger family protein [Anaerolineae bacterium]MDQ7036531.1 SWIM zinc finger family protein [Anaerolineae bacterium]